MGFLKLGVVSFVLSFVGPVAHAAKGTLENIQERKEIKVGIEAGFVPFEMKKPDGSWIGFDVDMLNAFGKELGVKTVFVDTPFDGIIPSLMTKKFDVIVSGMTITEERKKVVLFSDPYYKAGLAVLIGKTNIDKVTSATQLDDAKYVVAVKVGTTSATYAAANMKKAKIRILNTESDAANAVLLGKVDAFIYDKPFIQIFAKRNPGKVGALLENITAEDFGLAARKDDAALVSRFNQFLKNWKQSGQYDAAMKTHFETMPWLAEMDKSK